MALNSDKDIIKLIITAENLATDELVTLTTDLKQMGQEADKAGLDLDKLKIDRDVINSYKEVGDEVDRLGVELSKNEVAYENSTKEIKKNKKATDLQREALKNQNKELIIQRAEFRSQVSAYTKLTNKVKILGVDSKNVVEVQGKIATKLKQTSIEIERLNNSYNKNIDVLKKKTKAEEQSRVIAKQKLVDVEKAAALVEEEVAAIYKQIDAEQKLAIEQKELIANIKKYEVALIKLNDDRDKGNISAGNAVRMEKELRLQYKLTESQIATSRAAIKADYDVEKKAEAQRRVIAKQKLADIEKATRLVDEYSDSIKKEIAVEQKLSAEQKETIANIKKYEIALIKLNAERDKGKISAGTAIRREKELRQQYKLTEAQIATSRAAIKADSDVKKKNMHGTDLLTNATRRLAQAYTVLIAAQAATRAISTSVQNYGDLEQAIVKVEKTTGAAKDKLLLLTEQIVELSTEVTPTATNELLKMAEVAGQLGITGTENLLKMVRAADALEVSTNLSGESAATLLTRILQMTGEGIPQIDSLASVVVGLGNNFAVAEDEIVQMTKEVVTGAQALNLGSTAAAAYGTVLKEMGQTGERSRSSFFKLAQVIKQSVNSGGADLQRLIKYTGQTADEIEENLGDRPELVLSALIDGFAKARDNGENLTDVLISMGVNGIEAVSTIEALAKGNERLKDAMVQANQLAKEQDAHFKEAAKAYGTQNAAIGRLINKFTDLTTKIGEAYSDETDAAIRGATKFIDEQGESVAELMNLLGELPSALGEIFESFENLGSAFVGAESDISLLDFAIMSIRETFNLLQIAVNGLIFTFQKLIYDAANVIKFFDDNAISDDWLVDFRKGMNDTSDDIERDFQDMLNASDDFYKKSSSSYRDLITVADKYSGVISQLTNEEQKQLAVILTRGTYLEGEDKIIRRLSAALVSKNREVESGLNLSKDVNKATKESIKLETERNTKIREVGKSLQFYATQVESVNKLVKDGLITEQKSKEILNDVSIAIELKRVELSKLTTVQDNDTKAIVDNIKQNKSWIEINGERVDINKTLVDSQSLVSDSLTLANGYILKGIELQQYLNEINTQANLVNKLYTGGVVNQSNAVRELSITELDAVKSVEELTTKLKDLSLVGNERKVLILELKEAEESLLKIQQRKLSLIDLEGKRATELRSIQNIALRQLKELDFRYRTGAITYLEYTEKTQDLKLELELLAEVMGDIVPTTDDLKNSTDDLKNSTTEAAKWASKLASEIESSGESAGGSTWLMDVYTKALNRLNETYDYSSGSTEELTSKLSDLDDELSDLNKITMPSSLIGLDSFIMRTKAWTNAGIQNEKSTIRQTLALRDLINKVESGSMSVSDLANAAKSANYYFSELSDQQLDPLLNAIDEARQKFKSLNDEINGAIGSIEDRLDNALGNFESIRNRANQREIDDLNALIEEARAYGTDTQVQALQRAVRDLKKAQDVEFKKDFGGKQKGNRSNNLSQQEEDTSFGSGNKRNVTVTLIGPSGVSRDVTVVDGNSYDNMLNSIAEFGDINMGN